MPTYTEAGRGRKQCPKCKVYVGVRSNVCEGCGNSFESSASHVHVTPQSGDSPSGKVATSDSHIHIPPRRNGHLGQIGIPAGECPVKLKDTDTATVRAWAEKVKEHYLANERKTIATSGLIYYAREFYDCHSSEFKKVKQELLTLYPEVQGSDEFQVD